MFDSLASVFSNSAPGHLLAAGMAGAVGVFAGFIFHRIANRMPIIMQRDLDNFVAEETGKETPHKEQFNLIKPFHIDSEPLSGSVWMSFSAAALFALTVWMFGFSTKGIAAIVLVSVLLILTSIDAKTKLLPDDLTIPLIWAGLLANSFGIFVSLESALYGAVFGYMSLWSMYWIFKLVTGKEGMGYGDFKLLAALCAWFGVGALPTLLILAAGVGAVVGLSFITLSKRGRDYQMPFGPYLAGAGLLVLYFDQWTQAAVAMLLGQ